MQPESPSVGGCDQPPVNGQTLVTPSDMRGQQRVLPMGNRFTGICIRPIVLPWISALALLVAPTIVFGQAAPPPNPPVVSPLADLAGKFSGNAAQALTAPTTQWMLHRPW